MGMQVIDIVLLALFILAFIKGLLNGFVRQALSLLGIVIGIYLSFHFLDEAARLFTSATGHKATVLVLIVLWGLLFVLVGIVFDVLQRILTRLINLGPLGIINRLIGALASTLIAVIFLSVTLYLYDKGVKDIGLPKLVDESKPTVVYDPMLKIATETVNKYWPHEEKE